MTRSTLLTGLAALGGVLGLAAVGCESPLVGATCQPNFTRCDDECVNLRADFRNCGACGNRCTRFSCYQGSCTGAPQPAEADGGGKLLDAGARDADALGSADAASGDDPDAGLEGCAIGERECSGACVKPAKDPKHCGACDRACGGDEACSAGSCAPTCDGGLRACDRQCHDPTSDPEHCGACNARCASGICEQSSCADAVAGQLVVIGHDFSSANTAMRRIAGNAVFLARGAPVRVLAYRGEASSSSVRGVEAAIEFARAEIGRTWQQTEASADLVSLQLAAADVFLIHAQTQASSDTLRRLGRRWGTALSQFLARGGIVVLFEAPSSFNDGTFKLLDQAGLFGAQQRSEISAQALNVQTPGLGVALRVPDRYMSAIHTVSFEGLRVDGTAIVVDQAGDPVVVQRVFTP